MYTEQNKGFTVITNFGCDCHCKYCITKHHPILQNAVTDKSKIDWDYLEKRSFLSLAGKYRLL